MKNVLYIYTSILLLAITFQSCGNKYKYKARTNIEGNVTMSFLNSQKWGLGANKEGALTVWYSKDYDGSGTVESVKAANWTEISDRFNISTLYDFTLQESGNADITDLADGNYIYFAFKYLCVNTEDRPAEWHLDDLNIKMEVKDASAPLLVANESSPGFKPVDVQGVVSNPIANKWSWSGDMGDNGLWRMRGQDKVGGQYIVNEDWLITNAINLTKVAPDKGTPLKTYSSQLESFTYTYSNPGTYTVTLIGNNTTIDGNQEKITELTIEVTE